MNSLLVLFGICLVSGQVLSLSFQGPEDLKSNFISVSSSDSKRDQNESLEPEKNKMADQRDEMRKMRLFILGALTEKIVAWFFQDIIPKDVMHRAKRSLKMEGKPYFDNLFQYFL